MFSFDHVRLAGRRNNFLRPCFSCHQNRMKSSLKMENGRIDPEMCWSNILLEANSVTFSTAEEKERTFSLSYCWSQGFARNWKIPASNNSQNREKMDKISCQWTRLDDWNSICVCHTIDWGSFRATLEPIRWCTWREEVVGCLGNLLESWCGFNYPSECLWTRIIRFYF